jgi:septum formation protein
MRLILASQSPARRRILEQAGLSPEVIVSAVDETSPAGVEPTALAASLAEQKAETVFAGLELTEPLIVLGCDSVLVFAGQTLGKPASADAAAALWRRLRGQTGCLVTGHHLIVADPSPRRSNRVAQTEVHFADLTDTEIKAYVATGEPQRVAGGFTIDGLGGPFITGLAGDPHNVVGLSLPLLRLMLADLGITWTSLWPLGQLAV